MRYRLSGNSLLRCTPFSWILAGHTIKHVFSSFIANGMPEKKQSDISILRNCPVNALPNGNVIPGVMLPIGNTLGALL